MRAYDSIKAERGREATLETPDFLAQARKLLSRSVPVQLRMSGGSMRPAIEDGDIITIEPIADSPIRQGDIVLYNTTQDTAVIHRVVRFERSSSEKQIITRGDGATQNDLPVPLHRVLGRVKLVERAGQTVAMATQRVRMFDRVRSWFRRFKR
jgi:signal peptidase I